MKAIHHLTDDDLVAVGNIYSLDLSYFVAGWDYPESAAREREAHNRCERRASVVDAEMQRRGLRTTCSTLCPLGVRS